MSWHGVILFAFGMVLLKEFQKTHESVRVKNWNLALSLGQKRKEIRPHSKTFSYTEKIFLCLPHVVANIPIF